MKKLIVAVSLLLIAALALSVSAFGAANYGEKDYNLGNFTTKAPVLDGAFGADEYTTVYTLNAAAGYLEKDTDLQAGKILPAAANTAAVTKSIKVGLAHDAAYIYIAIEATLGEGVADAKYNVYGLDMIANEDEANDTTANEFSAIKNNVFVGEIKIAKDDSTDKVVSGVSEEVSDSTAVSLKYTDKYTVTEGTNDLFIIERTYDDTADANIINKGVWNAVKLSDLDRFVAAGKYFVANTFTVGAVAAAGSQVDVTMNAVVVPPVETTTEPATTEPATTEPATTEPATTEPATTESATTESQTVAETATTEPVVTESQTVAETEPAKGGCGSSISAMGIALVAVLGAGAVVLSKKED